MIHKMLVRYNLDKPDKIESDFLGLMRDKQGVVRLESLVSRLPAAFGAVINCGTEVDADRLYRAFEKNKIAVDSVEQTMKDLSVYVSEIARFEVGEVLEIVHKLEVPQGFVLRETEYGEDLYARFERNNVLGSRPR